MVGSRSSAALLPPGLIIENVRIEEGGVAAAARSRDVGAACPGCGRQSRRVHSRYVRSLSDLPAHGRRVSIALTVRRFRCGNDTCPREIFAERFGEDIVAPYARRTARLQIIVHHLGLALGGRPGQGLARRLLMPVSKDTLLRTVRARAPKARPTSRVIGIDDWAWKRGHRYGSIVCDLERREIINVLPDREAATVEAWMAAHPEVEIVSRDRGGGYGQAVARAAPEVVQVADRWHLMANASQAFLDGVRRSMTPIRRALGAGILSVFGVLPGLFSPATTGPMVREAQRHLATWVLQPIAELLAEEASAKLGTAVAIDTLTPVQAFDAGGSARAVAGIIDALAAARAGGLSPAEVQAAFAAADWGEIVRK